MEFMRDIGVRRVTLAEIEQANAEIDIPVSEKMLAHRFKKDMTTAPTATTGSNIQENQVMTLKGLQTYRVVHIEDPGRFYVHLPSQETSFSGGIGVSLMTSFKSYCESALAYQRHNPHKNAPGLGHCFAWLNPETNRWERVRVIEVIKGTQTSRIFLLDFGSSFVVDNNSLVILHPKFMHEYCRSFRAHLVDIVPVYGETWSVEAINFFKSLALGKDFQAVVMEITDLIGDDKDKKSGKTFTYENFSIGMVMVEKDSSARLCVNAELVNLGLAECVGLASSQFHIGVHSEIPNPFDMEEVQNEIQMLEAAEKENYKTSWETEGMREDDELLGACGGVDVPNQSSAPVSNVLSKAERERMRSKIISKESDVELFGLYYRTFTSSTFTSEESLDRLPREIRLRLGTCILTSILSPSCFYIQMIQKIPELKVMMKYLSQVAQDMPELVEEDSIDGTLVAILLLDDTGKPSWHRGIVRHSIYSIRLIKVILVDFGNEVSVKYSNVRKLPKYFCDIPGFAQRVHLDVKNLIPLGGKGDITCWTNLASDAFRKYLAVWEQELPVYYIWKRPGTDTIHLDEYNQELIFNKSYDTWEKEPGFAETAQHRKMQAVMKSPAGQNIFQTMGVEVVYEVIREGNRPYAFEKIVDCLIDKGFAIMRNQPQKQPRRSDLICLD